MDTTVDVGIDVQILVAHGIKHAERLLGRGTVVEIDQRAAVDLTAENGEVFPYFFYIQHGFTLLAFDE